MSSYSKTVTPGDDDLTRDVVLSRALWEVRLFSLGKMIILLSLFCLILISLFLVRKAMVITGMAPLAEEEHHKELKRCGFISVSSRENQLISIMV